MVTALVLSLLVTAAPPAAPAPGLLTPPAPAAKRKKPRKGPSAYDTALLYFLVGDLPKAQDWAKRGVDREKDKCLPLHQQLVEYAYLFGAAELTREQARDLVALDRKISPTVPSKLTEKITQRMVSGPLNLARVRVQAGDAPGARALLEEALFIDPHHAEAKTLLASLSTPDAGR